MNNVILSGKYPQFAKKLAECGFHVIFSETLDQLIPYERDHADLQCLILDGTAFIYSGCERLAEELSSAFRVVRCARQLAAKYPSNVALNALALGKKLIARLDSLDRNVLDHCRRNGYQLINVRQGYAKCACAVVDNNAIITADRGIYHSLEEYKIDVLLIEEGRVNLEGANYGFIGGASGYDQRNHTLYFCGDIAAHPDYERIKAFCAKYRTQIVSLTHDALTDIGGIQFC